MQTSDERSTARFRYRYLQVEMLEPTPRRKLRAVRLVKWLIGFAMGAGVILCIWGRR